MVGSLMDPGPVIVGREAELERLEAALDALAEARRAQVVQVVGEPGIGKTRLVAELCERAEERGHLVLSGLAAEFEHELPFGLVIDALDDYLAAAQGREVERIGGDMTPELATIFPSLREYVVEGAPRLQDERFRAHRAIRGLLEGLAASRPMVLALDDLHWADDASLEVVAALLRRPPAAPALITLAFRTRQEPELVAAARRAAEQRGWLDRIELGPLEQEAAGELLPEDLDAALTAELLRESGGNPFYLTELTRSATQRGPEASGNTHARAMRREPDDVPAPVAAALSEELRDLDHREIPFLRAAAVAGEPFEPDLAARIAELADEEALEILDRLLEVGVVRPTEVPQRFLFRHPLVRRAVYEGTPLGWRLAAHGRASHALETRGAGAVRRAHHVEHAAMPGDPEAIDVLVEAADAAAARAPASAVRWLEAALRLTPARGPLAERRPELLARLGSSQAAQGQLTDSIDTISELLELMPGDPVPERLQLIALRATMKNFLGEHEAARRDLLQYRSLIERGGREATMVQIELAVNALWTMDHEDCLVWAERAAACAEPLDDRPLRMAALGILGWAQMLLAQSDDGRRTCDAGAALIEELDEEAQASRLDGFVHLGWAEYVLGRYERSLAHLERGQAIARKSGQGQFLAVLGQARAVTLATIGRLATAREQSQATVEAARLGRNPQWLAYGLAASCWWATLEGDLDDADLAAGEVLELTDQLDANTVRLVAAGALAEYYIASGTPERGSEFLLSSCGGPELSLLAPGWHPMYLEILTRAELGADRPDEAAAAAERAESAARLLDLQTAHAHAARARGEVLLATGQPEAAAALARDAASSQRRAGAGFEAARSRLLAGRALAAAGDRERAVDELRASERELAACGATRLRDQAARELRRLGKRVRAAKPSAGQADAEGIDALSGREREVVELVADRLTNREIAEHLVLSEKTIETHLRNAFAKLGASSRVEVARAVERMRQELRA